jgi:nicotinamidase/pyrazinamidase
MKALVLVDIQKDFLPGGSLPVKNGHEVIPHANRLLQHTFDMKIATKDWHPQEHKSFAINHGKKPGEKILLEGLDQILWPVHCVQNTEGADFAPGLHFKKIEKVFLKGIDVNVDSYSTFFDNGLKRSTGLDDFLHQNGITDVYFAGLATDYCVFYSVMDALRLGFNTFVVVDACRGIDLEPGDTDRALKEMQRHGAHIVTVEQVEKETKHK